MLSLFLAAAVANTPLEAPARVATAQPAQAMVRIVRGAEIRLGQAKRSEESIIRPARIREPDGATHTASLIEFY